MINLIATYYDTCSITKNIAQFNAFNYMSNYSIQLSPNLDFFLLTEEEEYELTINYSF